MHSPSSPRIIRSEDADAVTQLQTKIAAAEKLQAMTKAANQIVRNPRLTDDEKVAQIVATCGLRDTSARELQVATICATFSSSVSRGLRTI